MSWGFRRLPLLLFEHVVILSWLLLENKES